MNTLTTKIAALLTAAALIFVAGMGLGWKLFRSKPIPQMVVAAPAQTQQDGSLILQTRPDAAAKPAQQVPTGGHVTRIDQVVVQPHGQSAVAPAPINGSAPPAAGPTPGHPATLIPCPPVTVDLTLIRMQDQSQRVVASSPDGDVVGGIDIPVEVPSQPRELKWAIGAVYGLGGWGQTSKGAFVDRDLAFFRIGAEITRDTCPTLAAGWSGRLKVGFRF
jgi:hypothetical protein